MPLGKETKPLLGGLMEEKMLSCFPKSIYWMPSKCLLIVASMKVSLCLHEIIENVPFFLIFSACQLPMSLVESLLSVTLLDVILVQAAMDYG